MSVQRARVLLSAASTGPSTWVADVVDNGQHMHQIIFDGIENTVGKSGQQGAANAWHDLWVQKGDLLHAFELKFKRQLKF